MRRKVAREAANLLYFGVEKEFKQAKLEATKAIGVRIVPTNLEVAIEFDKIADENEGTARQERLIQMRREALRLMQILKMYKPLLIGSVWRGAIHRESDIDIVVHHNEPDDVTSTLKQHDLKIKQMEWVTATKEGRRKTSFHIYAEALNNEKAEIKVVSPEEASRKEKCGIYGDDVTGLRTKKLQKLLKENPAQRFVPP